MHRRHNLYLKLHLHGRMHFYQRLQVVHPCITPWLQNTYWKTREIMSVHVYVHH